MGEERELSFEEALARLEEIVSGLDSGELALAEALALFEEGNKLREYCESKLAEAEAQVEELLEETADADGDAPADSLFG